MPWKRFNPCEPCCCYRTMVIIAIYDESQPVYSPTATTYEADKAQWETFIDGIERSQIRLGLMGPQGSAEVLKPASSPWPKDTDRAEIDTVFLPSQAPRVNSGDITSFFETIRTNPDPLGGDDGPDLLLFCLDNSGSILVSQYAAQLAAAKAELQAAWPKMKILDDVSSAGERYILDAYNGAKTRTCG